MTGLHFLLNGTPCREESASPSMTVLDWLRTRARLTGTKEGCTEGDCGACTIVLGRERGGSLRYEAVNSCLMLLPQIANCDVLTVEGLAAPDGMLHPVQQALLDADATQCGFCTPGFVLMVKQLLDEYPDPDDDRIRDYLAGNLCRCAAYPEIVEAVKQAAKTAPTRTGQPR